MNAGAYGGEMSQVVSTVTVVNRNGEIMELDNVLWNSAIDQCDPGPAFCGDEGDFPPGTGRSGTDRRENG